MRLGLTLTARCNASCDHCSTSCGPRRTERLSRSRIFSLMDEAAALSQGEVLKVGLSGGEPFLDFPLLLEVIAYAKKVGANEVTCVSNGYWATSDEAARARLRAVKDAGMDKLAVSTSRFHQRFVKIERIERALGAARAVGLECAVKYVRVRSDPDAPATVEAWARKAGACGVEVIPLLPALREGIKLPDREYERHLPLPEGPCPTPIVTVRETGEAYSCCTPGAFVDFLSLGSVDRLPLSEIQERFYAGGRQQVLRQHGPAEFARAVVARGEGHRLRAAYGGVCDLCTHIMSDSVMAAIATEVADAFEVRQLVEFLERAGGGASPAARVAKRQSNSSVK